MLIRCLAVSTDRRRARLLGGLLESDVTRTRVLGTPSDLWEVLRAEAVDLLAVEDDVIQGPPEAFIADLRALPGSPEVIVFTEDSDPERRAALQAAKAYAIIDRAASREEIAAALVGIEARLVERGHREILASQADAGSSLGDFASASPRMREFLGFVRKVVSSDSTLLVLGETGVGKEYLSRAIHGESPRSPGPFVPVSCSALSESLLESELFGHVEGAFTGAHRGRKGYFEMAHGGTLFLDEIGELRPQTQVKLLRVLQDKRVQPIGSEQSLQVDVRLIAATNRDLAQEVEAKRFRSDLFYRLSVVNLLVPPLRERTEDIPGLFESNVEDFCISMNRYAFDVREDAMERLVAYRWPGNVRELINVAERAVLLCEGREITPVDLPEEIRGVFGFEVGQGDVDPAEASPVGPGATPAWISRPFKDLRREVVDDFERRYLVSLLTRHHGHINEVSKVSGIHTRSLYEKMRRLGLRKEAFKLR